MRNNLKCCRAGQGSVLFALFFAGDLDIGELPAEFFDTPGGVDILEAAGIERMAGAANIDFQLRLGRTGHEGVSAPAGDLRLDIVGMDVLFHGGFL